ncbi:MAG: hypothetical protein FWB98_09095 [Defluviitaleaceae bacterium]|nr:hypothetical protein [Defluviitaleaceae bacterium]
MNRLALVSLYVAGLMLFFAGLMVITLPVRHFLFPLIRADIYNEMQSETILDYGEFGGLVAFVTEMEGGYVAHVFRESMLLNRYVRHLRVEYPYYDRGGTITIPGKRHYIMVNFHGSNLRFPCLSEYGAEIVPRLDAVRIFNRFANPTLLYSLIFQVAVKRMKTE